MSKPQNPDLAERAYKRTKIRDASAALPLLGVFLLVSPIITVFATDGLIFGLPLPFVYIFSVWFLLVWTARRLSRRLTES